MRAYKLDHLTDPELLLALTALVARERVTTADLMAHIAEVDARKLYAPAGHASMFAYCVEELRMSGDEAYKRIRAARAARRFPAIFPAVAKGRLHLTAVVLLAPYLTTENAAGLLEAAAHRTRSEIEELLALRFPRTEMMPLVHAIPSPIPITSAQLVPEPVVGIGRGSAGDSGSQLVPEPVAENGLGSAGDSGVQLVPEPVAENGLGSAGDSGAQLVPEPVAGSPTAVAGLQRPARVAPPAPAARLAPIAPGRFVLQVSIDQETHEMLAQARALASHQVPSGDLAEVLKRALRLYVAQLEKRKFAATDKPRARRRSSSANPRYIPAHVKRAVWERDQGRCTFVGDTGHRCGARRFLEFDHVEAVARGGQATVAGIRLRCRAHNQLEAERAFGTSFMIGKRETARRERRRQAALEHESRHVVIRRSAPV